MKYVFLTCVVRSVSSIEVCSIEESLAAYPSIIADPFVFKDNIKTENRISGPTRPRDLL